MRFVLSLGIAAAAAVFAAAVASAAPSYLTPGQYDPARLLPPPPADGSDAQKTEMAELHRVEAARTPEQFARSKKYGETENATIFADVVPGLDLDKLPVTAKLFADVREEEKAAVSKAKKFFQRTRPYVTDPALKSCAHNEDPKSSYPSGHSTMAYSMGVVLAALVPEKAQDILQRASDYAESRVICGVHYRRDIVAGEAYGTTIGAALLNNAAFKAEADAAAQELRAHHVAAAR